MDIKINKYKFFLLLMVAGLLFTSKVSAQDFSLTAQTLYSFGQAFFKQRKYTEAKQEFEKCLMLNPQHKRAEKLLRICKQRLVPQRDKTMLSALKEMEKKQEPLNPSSERTDWALKQGAWHLKEGDFYAEIYNKYYWHNQEFDSKGHKKKWTNAAEYYEIRTELKLEYGLTDKTSLLLYPVFKRTDWKDTLEHHQRTGFVEIWPGIRYLLFADPFFCWLRARVKLPAHYREGEGVAASLGTHQIDGEFKVLTAQPWPKLPGYTKFELGFKGRNEEPTNEIVYFTQLGYNLIENLILEVSLDGQEGLAQTGGKDEDWVKGTFGPIFKVGLMNIKLGYGNTFAGKNTSAAQEIYLNLYSWW